MSVFTFDTKEDSGGYIGEYKTARFNFTNRYGTVTSKTASITSSTGCSESSISYDDEGFSITYLPSATSGSFSVTYAYETTYPRSYSSTTKFTFTAGNERSEQIWAYTKNMSHTVGTTASVYGISGTPYGTLTAKPTDDTVCSVIVVGTNLKITGKKGGSTTLSVTAAGNSSYIPKTQDNITVTVSKGTPIITFADETLTGWTYAATGTNTATFTGATSSSSGTTTYSITSGEGPSGSFAAGDPFTISGTTLTFNNASTKNEVGTFKVTVKASVAETGGYKSGTATAVKTVTIDAKKDEISFSQTPNVTVGSTATAIATAKSTRAVSYKSSNESVATINSSTGVITGKSIGTTTITASVSEGKVWSQASDTYTCTVSAGTITISVSGTGSTTYNKQSHELTVSTTPSSVDKLSYGTTSGSYPLTTLPTITNVGSLTTYIKAEKAGYTTAYNNGTITITPASAGIAISPAEATIDYGDPIPSFTVTTSGVYSGDSLGTLSYTRDSGTDAGSYNVYPQCTGNDNYSVTPTNGKLIINQINDNVYWSSFPTTVVLKERVSYGATCDSGTTISYSSSNSSVINCKDTYFEAVGLGTATITATSAGNINYISASEDFTATVKQKLTITTEATLKNPPYMPTSGYCYPIDKEAKCESGGTVYYKLDNGTETPYYYLLSTTSTGSHTLKYYAKSTDTSKYIDSDVKTVTFTVKEAPYTFDFWLVSQGYYYYQPETIDVFVTVADWATPPTKIKLTSNHTDIQVIDSGFVDIAYSETYGKYVAYINTRTTKTDMTSNTLSINVSTVCDNYSDVTGSCVNTSKKVFPLILPAPTISGQEYEYDGVSSGWSRLVAQYDALYGTGFTNTHLLDQKLSEQVPLTTKDSYRVYYHEESSETRYQSALRINDPYYAKSCVKFDEDDIGGKWRETREWYFYKNGTDAGTSWKIDPADVSFTLSSSIEDIYSDTKTTVNYTSDPPNKYLTTAVFYDKVYSEKAIDVSFGTTQQFIRITGKWNKSLRTDGYYGTKAKFTAILDDGNYEGSLGEKSVLVKLHDQTLPVYSCSKVVHPYTGLPITLATLTNTPSGGTLSAFYAKSETGEKMKIEVPASGDIQLTEKSKYWLWFTYSPNDNYYGDDEYHFIGQAEIGLGDPVYTKPVITPNCEWDDIAKDVCSAGSVTKGGELRYYVNGKPEEGTAEVPSRTDRGKYTVKYTIAETASYKGVEEEIGTFEITQRDTTLTAKDHTYRYLEIIPSKFTDITISKALVYDDDLGEIYGTTTAKKGDPVGDYPITVQYTSNDNYKVTTVPATAKIIRAVDVATWTPIENFHVTDADREIKAEFTSKTAVTYKITAGSQYAEIVNGKYLHAKAAGTCTITATSAGNEKYESGTGTMDVKIKEYQEIVYETRNYWDYYDAQEHHGEVVIADTQKKYITVKYRLNDTEEWSTTQPKHIDAGDTKVYVQLSGDEYITAEDSYYDYIKPLPRTLELDSSNIAYVKSAGRNKVRWDGRVVESIYSRDTLTYSWKSSNTSVAVLETIEGVSMAINIVGAEKAKKTQQSTITLSATNNNYAITPASANITIYTEINKPTFIEAMAPTYDGTEKDVDSEEYWNDYEYSTHQGFKGTAKGSYSATFHITEDEEHAGIIYLTQDDKITKLAFCQWFIGQPTQNFIRVWYNGDWREVTPYICQGGKVWKEAEALICLGGEEWVKMINPSKE